MFFYFSQIQSITIEKKSKERKKEEKHVQTYKKMKGKGSTENRETYEKDKEEPNHMTVWEGGQDRLF